MGFVRFDAGEVLRKERGGQEPKILPTCRGYSAHHEGDIAAKMLPTNMLGLTGNGPRRLLAEDQLGNIGG